MIGGAGVARDVVRSQSQGDAGRRTEADATGVADGVRTPAPAAAGHPLTEVGAATVTARPDGPAAGTALCTAHTAPMHPVAGKISLALLVEKKATCTGTVANTEAN